MKPPIHAGLLILALTVSGAIAMAEQPSTPTTTAQQQQDKGTIYSPIGKRDPFKVPSSALGRELNSNNPLERFSIEQLQLRAILRSNTNKARAMFEDPEGHTHIIIEGEVIGREHATVSRILNTEVILTERTFNYLGQENLYEKIVSLPEETDNGVQIQRGGAGGKNVEVPLGGAQFDAKNLQPGAPPPQPQIQNAPAPAAAAPAPAPAPAAAPAAAAPAPAPAGPDPNINRNLVTFPKR